jgi:hypothetical protein
MTDLFEQKQQARYTRLIERPPTNVKPQALLVITANYWRKAKCLANLGRRSSYRSDCCALQVACSFGFRIQQSYPVDDIISSY